MGIRQTQGSPATTTPVEWSDFLVSRLNITSDLTTDGTKPIQTALEVDLNRYAKAGGKRIKFDNKDIPFKTSNLQAYADKCKNSGTDEGIALAIQINTTYNAIFETIAKIYAYENLVKNIEFEVDND